MRAESFAESRFADGSFDLTVGNVPFGRIALHDRRHNPGGHTLHNHFLIKSLHLTRPGGLVVAITSRYTLDARNPAARREMAGLADLVGAVRLPTDAHQRAAGTSVITDLLVLRRCEPGRAGNGEQWERVLPLSVPPTPQLSGADPAEAGWVEVNQWFHDHPEQVLGGMRAGRGAHRDDELHVLSARPLEVTLPAALERITTHARSAGLRTAPPAAADADPATRPLVTVDREGLIQDTDGGGFTRVVGGVLAPYGVPGSQAAELRALLGLRDTAVALLDAESATGEDTDTDAGQMSCRLGEAKPGLLGPGRRPGPRQRVVRSGHRRRSEVPRQLWGTGWTMFIGPRAEERFGRRHFMGMTAVFARSAWPTRPCSPTGSAAAVAGRTQLAVTWIDWTRKRCFVEAVDRGGRARWHTGGVGGAGFALSRSVREVLLGDDPPVRLTARAEKVLAEARQAELATVHPGGPVITGRGPDLRW